jgi:hypothetical protein
VHDTIERAPSHKPLSKLQMHNCAHESQHSHNDDEQLCKWLSSMAHSRRDNADQQNAAGIAEPVENDTNKTEQLQRIAP